MSFASASRAFVCASSSSIPFAPAPDADFVRRLSRETMRIVQQNFAMVVGINTVGLILGASSGISVMMSALMHNMSTILVVANSLRLMFFPPIDA